MPVKSDGRRVPEKVTGATSRRTPESAAKQDTGTLHSGLNGHEMHASGSTQCECPPSEAREISLTRGFVTIVDEADYEWLSRWLWQIDSGGYARHGITGGRHVYMHRHILGLVPGDGLVVDHINGDQLDNRRVNLRVCTHHQNLMNSRRPSGKGSHYRGVRRTSRSWIAQITFCGRLFYLGTFLVEEDAARAYDVAARELHGEFARLNFPEVAS